MALQLSVPQKYRGLEPKITVLGVGGAGGNAVNNMIQAKLSGVDFVVANTDAQALSQSHCERRIQLGTSATQGLGAGSKPVVGEAAAQESLHEVLDAVEGCNLVFITAGMGGGTGTGAAPVLAQAIREKGILTIGVVTKPFQFEGLHRSKQADLGIKALEAAVDTLIVIPNQNLFRIANDKTTFSDAFKMADDVLYSGVRGISDLMVMPGMINLDFADVRSLMTVMGKAMMGTGEAAGDRRAVEAAEAAIANPLLDDASISGAKGALINISGGSDLTLFEVDEAANRIRDELHPEANIIFGSAFDENLAGSIRVSIVATGINGAAMAMAVETEDKAELEIRASTTVTQPARNDEGLKAEQPQPAPREAFNFSNPLFSQKVSPPKHVEAARESLTVNQDWASDSETVEAETITAEVSAEAPAVEQSVEELTTNDQVVAPASGNPFSLSAILGSNAQRPAPVPQNPERSLFVETEAAETNEMPLFAQRNTEETPAAEPTIPTRKVFSTVKSDEVGAAVQTSERPATHQQMPSRKGFFSRLHDLSPFAQQDQDDLSDDYVAPSPSLNGNNHRETAQVRPTRMDAQPRLVGVQGGKPTQSKDKTFDEDLLDIPAFLRRQAN